MAPGLLVPLALLVATISIAVCAPICPSITRARRHYRLEVVKTPFLLPDGSRFSAGVTYNGSYIGPTITATLGEELSVDVFNKGPVGMSSDCGHGTSFTPIQRCLLTHCYRKQ